MSQLVEVLYPVPDLRRTALSSLRWWESRRLVYNKVVGATGLVTLAWVSILSILGPATLGGFNPLPLLAGAVVYGIAANVCYSLGWMVELAARALWGRQAPNLGPLLFRQGLIFSVGLTLLPVLLVTFLWIVHIAVAIVT
ncbi:MAG TPA: hypothetical protein VFS20_07065 [Longimicrobium sp.]|nr:hypothetical protein [Longimicrobium sp.]